MKSKIISLKSMNIFHEHKNHKKMRVSKKIIVVFAILLSCFNSLAAQKEKLEQLFDKYQDTEGVTSIKIAKPMFGMLNSLDIKDSELSQIKPLLSKIQGLKILVIEQPEDGDAEKPASFYQNLSKEILTSVNNLKYEELMTVNSKDSKIKFLTSDTANGILDNLLLNISSEGNTVLMMLDGKISMDDVNNLINEAQISSSKTSETTENTGSSEVTQVRNVGKFTGIEVSGGIKVNFTQGNNQSVVVDADQNLQQYVSTEVKNGILIIKIKDKKNLNFKKLLVTIEAPNLQSIKTTSGASFATMNTVKETVFDVSAESGSTLNADLKANATINLKSISGASMKINADTMNLIFNGNSGSSSVIVGKAETASYVISSAATCNAQNTVVKTAEVSATSGASLKVNASKYLNSQTSSGASVRYAGKPKKVQSDNSSGGSTKEIN
ncbi:MAG: DUF4252 domain-containing protein [Bergeyella sp.]